MKVMILLLVMAFAAVAGEVNVYTHRHYEADRRLFSDFTKKTGIKVNAVSAKADQLMERLAAEGKNSPADLLITVDVGRLHKAKVKGLLQVVSSTQLDAAVPKHLRDPQGFWFGITKRARVIVYHKDRVQPSELSTYLDLADPKWKGRILIRSSGNIYNQSLMASMIARYGHKGASSWASGLVKNLARMPKGNDRDQMRAVAAGEADLAVVNTYYLGKLMHGDAKDQAFAKTLRIFFPDQKGKGGTHINVSGFGVTKHAKNKGNAIKLMEFLVSDAAQRLLAESNHEYPVKPGIKMSELVGAWGSFKEDSTDLALLGKHNKLAVMLMDRAGWK